MEIWVVIPQLLKKTPRSQNMGVPVQETMDHILKSYLWCAIKSEALLKLSLRGCTFSLSESSDKLLSVRKSQQRFLATKPYPPQIGGLALGNQSKMTVGFHGNRTESLVTTAAEVAAYPTMHWHAKTSLNETLASGCCLLTDYLTDQSANIMPSYST